MKRSRSVAIPLMMGTVALTLAGCEEPTPKDVSFTSLTQCLESGIEAATCAAAYEKAVAAHAAQAPRFASVEECQKATDSDCRPSQVRNEDGSIADVIVPMMAGYMISQALDGGRDREDRRVTSGYSAAPIYSSRSYSGSYRDLPAIRSPQRASVPSVPSAGVANSPSSTYKALPPPNVKTSTISRGGFSGFGRGASVGG